VIPGPRGQGEGVGGDLSGVHDVLLGLRFFGARRRPFLIGNILYTDEVKYAALKRHAELRQS
jgi:hypothetical protein